MEEKGTRERFRERFNEKLNEGTYAMYSLPENEEYQYIVGVLHESSTVKDRAYYYLRQKFEIMDVGGIKKIIKVTFTPVLYFLNF